MFQFEFAHTHKILRCLFAGHVTDGELIDYYAVVTQHATRLTPSAGIADFSAVTWFDVFPTTVRKLAESDPAMPDPAVPRFVVAPTSIEYGLSKLFEAYGEKTRPNLYVVRSAEEVWRILNIEEPRFEPLVS